MLQHLKTQAKINPKKHRHIQKSLLVGLFLCLSHSHAHTTTYLPPMPNNPMGFGHYGGFWWTPHNQNSIWVAPILNLPPWAAAPENYPMLFRHWPTQPVTPTGIPFSYGTAFGPDTPIFAHNCGAVQAGPIPDRPPHNYNGVLIEPDHSLWTPGSYLNPQRVVWSWQCAAWGTALNLAPKP